MFAFRHNQAYGGDIARALGLELAPVEERRFEDGEYKTRSLANVRDRDVFVVDALLAHDGETVNDRLVRLLFFIGALHDASAGRIHVVLPYFAYSRKDRKTKPRDPLTLRYLAAMFEACGAHRVLTLDVHNLAAWQNAFRIPTEHLEAYGLFVEHFRRIAGERPVAVVSPDAGGMKRAEAFRLKLAETLGRDVAMGFVEKYRSEGKLSGEAMVGDVAGRMCILIDDLISTGNTLVRAARACLKNGAAQVWGVATHGVFSEEAPNVLVDPVLTGIVVTDTIALGAPIRDALGPRLTVLPTAPLVAQAIRRIHEGGSLAALMQGD